MPDARSCPNPECGCPVQPGDKFCNYCGRELCASGPMPAVAGAGLVSAAGPEGRSGAERLTDEVRGEMAREAAALKAEGAGLRQEIRVEAASGTGESDTSVSECQELDVRYNNSRVFVVGMQSTFELEIVPRAEGVDSLLVQVRHSGRVIAQDRPLVIARRDSKIRCYLNYVPQAAEAGVAAFTILLGYRAGGQARLFAASRTHTIYSGREDARSVCEKLVVEVKNNIQQGNAGDLRVDQDFSGLREALRERNSITLDREFLELINRRPSWATLPLGECATSALSELGMNLPAPVAARCDRLLLRPPSDRDLRFYAVGPVRVGRAKDCEMVARVLDSSGRELREPSIQISRYHAFFEFREGAFRLVDRGYYPEEGRWRPSAQGVFVDERRMAEGGELVLAPGREYRVTLAEPGSGVFGMRGRVWSAAESPCALPGCKGQLPAPLEPVCLVIAPEAAGLPVTVLVVQRVNGRALDARWGSLCICREHGCFRACGATGQDWLIPGRPLVVGHERFEVQRI